MSEKRGDDSADVSVGTDGWLFLTGGKNNVLELYTSEGGFSQSSVSSWLKLLELRSKKASALGAVYCHITVPEKLTIYNQHHREQLPYLDNAPSYRLPKAAHNANLEKFVVDLLPYFNSEKHKIQLYWKTDTHWTFEGAYSAYQVICAKLDAKMNTSLPHGKMISGSLVLDLGGKLSPPVSEIFVTVQFMNNAKRIASNSLVNFKEKYGLENDGGLHVGSNVVFVNYSETADPRSVVLFGDSFSEYRTHLLTGMLAETFKEVHFVWSANIDWSYVERARPDILLTEMAERFMGTIPEDSFELDRIVHDKISTRFPQILP